LNETLIEIAFNRLEYSNDCSLEAKIYVSRLISMILKFPQVQERMIEIMLKDIDTSESMSSDHSISLKKKGGGVVAGLCNLLLIEKQHVGIIRNSIKACTYISMNYDFIKESSLSLKILSAMLSLLDTMEDRDD
jgi:hypothetical protein